MRFAAAFAFLFVSMAGPAHAGLKLCNQTSYVIYAATAYVSAPNIVTHGWTRIVPGACETAISGALAAPSYYVYARTSEAHAGRTRVWGGADEFCAREENFALTTQAGLPGCGEDSFAVPFAKIDTRAMASWTTTFTESARIKTMADARQAGIDRLLRDNGYKGGRATALAQFRARMKLPAEASARDLFDALETEAMKAAAPAGYSICNDSDSAIWAALGMKAGKAWLTRGWWKVMPGACAHAITDPLSAEKIYLHAEGHGDHNLVSGRAKLCIADITFEVTGSGACAKEGLKEAGFAETDTKDVSGYAAHIGQDGLLPPMPHASTPK
jgi:uncharacterized membrane protein